MAGATDWLEAYEQIHAKYRQYGHCLLYQECGLLINSARFAMSIDDAFCKQVSQGCDTDCFGEIIGLIMGAYLGPGHLEARWLTPFNDDLHTSWLAGALASSFVCDEATGWRLIAGRELTHEILEPGEARELPGAALQQQGFATTLPK